LLQQTLLEGNETYGNVSAKPKTEKGQYRPFLSNYLSSGTKTVQAEKPKVTLERSIVSKPVGVSLTLSKVQSGTQNNLKRDSGDKQSSSLMRDKLPQMFSQKQHLRELLTKAPGAHAIKLLLLTMMFWFINLVALFLNNHF